MIFFKSKSDPILGQYGRIADIISFTAVILAILYMGRAPSERKPVSPKVERSGPKTTPWFSQSPRTMNEDDSKKTHAPKIELHKNENPKPTIPSNSDKMILFPTLKKLFLSNSETAQRPNADSSFSLWSSFKKLMVDPEYNNGATRNSSTAFDTWAVSNFYQNTKSAISQFTENSNKKENTGSKHTEDNQNLVHLPSFLAESEKSPIPEESEKQLPESHTPAFDLLKTVLKRARSYQNTPSYLTSIFDYFLVKDTDVQTPETTASQKPSFQNFLANKDEKKSTSDKDGIYSYIKDFLAESETDAPEKVKHVEFFSSLKNVLTDTKTSDGLEYGKLLSALQSLLANSPAEDSDTPKINSNIGNKKEFASPNESTNLLYDAFIKAFKAFNPESSMRKDYSYIFSLVQNLLADSEPFDDSSRQKNQIQVQTSSAPLGTETASPKQDFRDNVANKNETNLDDLIRQISDLLKTYENKKIKKTDDSIISDSKRETKDAASENKKHKSDIWPFVNKILASSNEEYILKGSSIDSKTESGDKLSKNPPRENDFTQGSFFQSMLANPAKEETQFTLQNVLNSVKGLLAQSENTKDEKTNFSKNLESSSFSDFLKSILASTKQKTSQSFDFISLFASSTNENKKPYTATNDERYKWFEQTYKSNSLSSIADAFKILLADSSNGKSDEQSSVDLSKFTTFFKDIFKADSFSEAKKSFKSLIVDEGDQIPLENAKGFFSDWALSSKSATNDILRFISSLLASNDREIGYLTGDSTVSQLFSYVSEASTSDEKGRRPDERLSCQSGYKGIDSTWDAFCESCSTTGCSSNVCVCQSETPRRLICGDNRYKTLPGKAFLCQASCNIAPFNCPTSECACENPGMETTKQCSSPTICKNSGFKSVPGTIATDQWCQKQCTSSSDSQNCPCTLCECKDTCSQGLDNGNFAQGLNGWSVVRQAGSGGIVTATDAGKLLPISLKSIPAFGKTRVAAFDSNSGGSYVLYQTVSPKAGDILKLSWMVSSYGPFSISESMSANIRNNQQFRIDILRSGSSSWFDEQNGHQDVLTNILSPVHVKTIMNALGQPPFKTMSPWQTLQYDLSSFVGQKVIIAFRAVNTLGQMNVALSNVELKNKDCVSSAKSYEQTQVPVKLNELEPRCGNACQTTF